MASIPVWLTFGTLTVWHIYLVCLVEGILFVLFNIAEAAVLPRVVPSDLLPQASGANEAGFGAALVVGPLLGTFLYQSISHAAPFVVGAACFVACLGRCRYRGTARARR
jgi:predicted MFS family arabinose efflux permease